MKMVNMLIAFALALCLFCSSVYAKEPVKSENGEHVIAVYEKEESQAMDFEKTSFVAVIAIAFAFSLKAAHKKLRAYLMHRKNKERNKKYIANDRDN